MEGKRRSLIKEIASAVKEAEARVLLLSDDIFDRVFKGEVSEDSDSFGVSVELTADKLHFIFDEFGEEILFSELDERALSSILKELKSGKFKVLEKLPPRD